MVTSTTPARAVGAGDQPGRESAPCSRSSARSAVPWPSKTSATRQPAGAHRPDRPAARRCRRGRRAPRRTSWLATVVSAARRCRAPMPHHGSPARGGLGHVVQVAQRGRAEVHRGLAAAGRGRPGRGEELLGGAHQVVGPGAHPLGVADARVGAGRQFVEHQLQLVDEHRARATPCPRRHCRG